MYPFIQNNFSIYRLYVFAGGYRSHSKFVYKQDYVFNISKCKQMLLSRKRNSATHPLMLLNGFPLEIMRSYKYLGFLMTSDLSWRDHIGFLCSKAKKMLRLLYRQFSSNSSSRTMKKLYLPLVRPLMECGGEVWHPHFPKTYRHWILCRSLPSGYVPDNGQQITNQCWTNLNFPT